MPDLPISLFPQQMAQGFDMLFTQGNTFLQSIMNAQAQGFETMSRTIQATNANIVNGINNFLGGLTNMAPAPLTQIGSVMPQGGAFRNMASPMPMGLPPFPFPFPGMPGTMGGQASPFPLPLPPFMQQRQKQETPQAPPTPGYSDLFGAVPDAVPKNRQAQQTKEELADQQQLNTGLNSTQDLLMSGFSKAPVKEPYIDSGIGLEDDFVMY